jgi:hypothetical protein
MFIIRPRRLPFQHLPNGIVDETIIIDGDNRSKDDDDNFDTKTAPRALDSGQANNGAFNLETSPFLPIVHLTR